MKIKSLTSAIRNKQLKFMCVVVPSLAFFLAPTLFWDRNFSRLAVSVGGDYPNLLFLNPNIFINHLGFHTFSTFQNSTCLTPYWSIATLASLINSIGLNCQLVIAGLVISGTFLGVMFLVLELSTFESETNAYTCGLFAGLVAVCSPFVGSNFFSVWTPGLLLLPFVPWMCIFFFRYCKTKKIVNALFAAIGTLFCSAGIADLPYSQPCLFMIIVIVSIGIYVCDLWNRQLVGSVIVFAVIILAINFVWVEPWLQATLFQNQQVQFALSNVAKKSAKVAANDLSHYSNIKDNLALNNSRYLISNFGWPQSSFSGWYNKLWLIGIAPVVIIFFGFFSEATKSIREEPKRSALTSMIIVCALFVGLVSLQLPGFHSIFNWLMDNAPGFVAERNFWAVFTIPLVLSVALTVGLSLAELSKRFKPKLFSQLVIVSSTLFLLLGIPLLDGSSYRLPYSEKNSPPRLVSNLPGSYSLLSDLINSKGGGPVLSLPLTSSGSDWTYLAGDNANSGTYLGISPLLYLYGIENFVSTLSMSNSSNSSKVQRFADSITENKPAEFSSAIRELGVEWILFNKSATSQPYYAQFKANSDVSSFDTNVINLLGAKVYKSAGSFTLYRIPTFLRSSFIGVQRTSTERDPRLSGECNQFASIRTDIQASSILLKSKHPVASGACSVIIRLPFSSRISMLLKTENSDIQLQHQKFQGYMNEFLLPSIARGKYTLEINYGETIANKYGSDFAAFITLLVLGLIFIKTFSKLRR